MTTGSTLAECAAILTEAGAIVDIAVIARRQTR
jgi:predicted amidophosphoribosyltransferase